MNLVDTNGNIVSESQFRQSQPYISLPAVLTQEIVGEYGYGVLNETEFPQVSDYFTVVAGVPAKNTDGSYTQVWVPTPIPLADAQTLALATLAAIRYTQQTAAVTINGVSISATPDSITFLNSAIGSLNGSTTATVNFKASSGWTQLTLAQLQEFMAAINLQIQHCFSYEYALTQNIMSLKSTSSISSFDMTSGW